ncbi:hypothetical protein Pfo_026016 [Paulownia fortunei]|nr:hypothetical protein Pfo_026016 [Paulownia fortunei]
MFQENLCHLPVLLITWDSLSCVFELRLLRVLDVFDMEFHQFPTEILQLVNLRYLAFSCNSALPCAISRVWNLQTLIVRSNSNLVVPTEIWEMSELRHVKFKKTIIRIQYDYTKKLVQEKLQTISTMYLYGLTVSDSHGSIPNIKKLGISCVSSPPSVVDLNHLHKLETLKCSSKLSTNTRTFLSALRFPPPVRKLTLSKCALPWRFMTTIGSLPNLEVFKIRSCAFEGQEIQPKDEEYEETEGEFFSLQFLLLENLNLVGRRPMRPTSQDSGAWYSGLLCTRGNSLWHWRNSNTGNDRVG